MKPYLEAELDESIPKEKQKRPCQSDLVKANMKGRVIEQEATIVTCAERSLLSDEHVIRSSKSWQERSVPRSKPAKLLRVVDAAHVSPVHIHSISPLHEQPPTCCLELPARRSALLRPSLSGTSSARSPPPSPSDGGEGEVEANRAIAPTAQRPPRLPLSRAPTMPPSARLRAASSLSATSRRLPRR